MTLVTKNVYLALTSWRDDALSQNPSAGVTDYGLCDYVFNRYHYAGNDFSRLLKDNFGMFHQWYPFNKSPSHFVEECISHESHLNPERRAWVECKIAEYEEQLQ